MTVQATDVLIIGAGAAGMMCAIEAGRRGRRVRIIDHARKPGEKIRISGGGRCNFTNLGCGPHAFLGANPRFATSALKRFTPRDFVARLDRAGIGWHEKDHGGRALGQLFCNDSAKAIIQLLTDQMRAAGATLSLGVSVQDVQRHGEGFQAALSDGSSISCASLVLATGGKSIPKMGASDWALTTARAFGLSVTETRPGLVPLTFDPDFLARWGLLSGLAVEAEVRHTPPSAVPDRARPRKATGFQEGLLFTHRGLSGPSILQISSYWREGEAIDVDLMPRIDALAWLKTLRRDEGRKRLLTGLGQGLPHRLAEAVAAACGLDGNLADQPDRALHRLAAHLNQWKVVPTGSEGYRTAEVMLGGVDTAELDQTSLMARRIPGLHVIGEAVDVTGWLGGYNFQWAWSSGWAAGQAV